MGRGPQGPQCIALPRAYNTVKTALASSGTNQNTVETLLWSISRPSNFDRCRRIEISILNMFRKGTKEDTYRPSRPRKRKFQGYRCTSDKENAEAGPSNQPSASKRKLTTTRSNDNIIISKHCYRIIEFLTVFGAISDIVVCKDCKQKVNFDDSGHRGLGFKIVISCQCGNKDIHSGPFIMNSYEVNRRIVFVMRLLGFAREGVNMFCGLMDIGKGISKNSYSGFVKHIHTASKTVFDGLCQEAVKQEQEENKKNGRGETNLKVSGDGSWKKRGFTSLYGVTTLIGYYSGKVIDLIVKASYCQACTYSRTTKTETEFEKWFEDHEEECAANHSGSAGKMEVDSIKAMFSRSEEKFNVKYGNYIGDGDSKTYKAIVDLTG